MITAPYVATTFIQTALADPYLSPCCQAPWKPYAGTADGERQIGTCPQCARGLVAVRDGESVRVEFRDYPEGE